MLQRMLDHGYDGDGFWATFGLFSLIVLCYLLIQLSFKRKLGQSLKLREVAFMLLLLLAFSIIAVVQIVLHHKGHI